MGKDFPSLKRYVNSDYHFYWCCPRDENKAAHQLFQMIFRFILIWSDHYRSALALHGINGDGFLLHSFQNRIRYLKAKMTSIYIRKNGANVFKHTP